MVLIEAGLAYNKTQPSLHIVMVIIWDKQPEPNYAPIVIEEPVEELLPDEEEELIEEVKTATVNPAYKGFGS
jgi:hypothetical protein